MSFPYAPTQHPAVRNDHATLAVTLACLGVPIGAGAVLVQSNFSILVNTASSLLTVLVFVSPSIVGACLGVRGMYQHGARFSRAATAFGVGAIGTVLVFGLWWAAYLYARHELLSLFN